jgi:hypothetical protein
MLESSKQTLAHNTVTQHTDDRSANYECKIGAVEPPEQLFLVDDADDKTRDDITFKSNKGEARPLQEARVQPSQKALAHMRQEVVRKREGVQSDDLVDVCTLHRSDAYLLCHFVTISEGVSYLASPWQSISFHLHALRTSRD